MLDVSRLSQDLGCTRFQSSKGSDRGWLLVRGTKCILLFLAQRFLRVQHADQRGTRSSTHGGAPVLKTTLGDGN